MTEQENTITSGPVKIGRYANVLMDRWFKRTFGWAPARRLMQLFLQEMIPERTITEISFGPQEHINPIEAGKDIRLDVHCKDAADNLFIVEVQLSEQDTFYERAVFNSSFIIQEQLPPGSGNWDFAPIYFIGIVNFSIHKDSDRVLYRYKLRETESGETMTDRIEYLFLEVPNCINAMTPKATVLDNLCYALQNMPNMSSRPESFKGEIFELLFNSAEISKFAPREQNEYISDMTNERDRINQMAFAKKKGVEEGLKEGRLQIAKSMLSDGMDPQVVSKYTGISIDDVNALNN